jgi:hypothetical protein
VEVAKFTTNSFVVKIFDNESLYFPCVELPFEQNITCGGSSATALKYEYGAKFAIPVLLIEEIHPIGLGKTSDLNGSILKGLPFFGS